MIANWRSNPATPNTLARETVPLGPTPTSGLFGCPPCLTRLVARARRSRDNRLVQNAEQAKTESARWEAERERYLADVTRVREAAEAVATLADEGTVTISVAREWQQARLRERMDWLYAYDATALNI